MKTLALTPLILLSLMSLFASCGKQAQTGTNSYGGGSRLNADSGCGELPEVSCPGESRALTFDVRQNSREDSCYVGVNSFGDRLVVRNGAGEAVICDRSRGRYKAIEVLANRLNLTGSVHRNCYQGANGSLNVDFETPWDDNESAAVYFSVPFCRR